MSDWKAIKPRDNGDWELYELSKDISETTNVAAQHPDLLEKLINYAEQSHVPAEPGAFIDRTRHEADRRAKWGTSRG